MVLARFIKITEDMCVCMCSCVCPQLTPVKKEVSRSSRPSTLSSSKKLGGIKLRRRRGWAVLSPNVRPCQKETNVVISGIEEEGRSQTRLVYLERSSMLTSKWSGGCTEQQCDLCKAGD